MDKYSSSSANSGATQPLRPKGTFEQQLAFLRDSKEKAGRITREIRQIRLDIKHLRAGILASESQYCETWATEASLTSSQDQHYSHGLTASYPRESPSGISATPSDYGDPGLSQDKFWTSSDSPLFEPDTAIHDVDIDHYGQKIAIDILTSVALPDRHFPDVDPSTLTRSLTALVQRRSSIDEKKIPVDNVRLSKDPSFAWSGKFYPSSSTRSSGHYTSKNLQLRASGNSYSSFHAGHMTQARHPDRPACVHVVYDICGYCVTALLYDRESGRLKRVWIYERPGNDLIDILEDERHFTAPHPYFSHFTRHMTCKKPKVRINRGAFHRQKWMLEKPVQEVFRRGRTEGSPSYPPVSSQNSSFLSSEPGLWGRKHLTTWKRSCGLHKEWRHCRYIKITKKCLTRISTLRRNWRTEISWKPSLHELPISVLRRHRAFKLRPSVRSRRASGSRDSTALGRLITSTLRDIYDDGIDDYEYVSTNLFPSSFT
jgi:hypothetical protein